MAGYLDAMYLAVKERNLDQLLPLLGFYDQNEVNKNPERCPLQAAIQFNYMEFIPYLLNAGAVFNPRYTESDVLYTAIKLHRQKALDMFDELAHDQVADALTFRNEGLTPFLFAAKNRNVEAMRLLTRVRPNSVARARARQLNIRPPLSTANREVLDAVVLSTLSYPSANALTLAVRVNDRLVTSTRRPFDTRTLYDTVKFLFDKGVVPLNADPLIELFRLFRLYLNYRFNNLGYIIEQDTIYTIYNLALMLSHGLTLEDRQRALLNVLTYANGSKTNISIILIKELVRALYDNDPQGPLLQENIAALFQAFQMLYYPHQDGAMTEVLLFVFRKAVLTAADINPLLPDIFALDDTRLLHCILKRFLVQPAIAFSDMQKVHGKNLPQQLRHMMMTRYGSLNITPEMRASPTPAGDLLREALSFPRVQYYLSYN